jgi:hypothetical protein
MDPRDSELPPLDWQPTAPAELGALVHNAQPEAPRVLGRGELIDARADFHAAIMVTLREATEAEVAQIWCCDRDFAHWPLGERAFVDLLAAWIGPRRQLTLIAGDFGGLALQAPRFIAWRREWAHAVECLIAHPDDAPRLPSLLMLPKRVQLRLSDVERYRGRVSRDAVDLSAGAELIDAVVQRVVGNFGPTTLGL